MNQGKQGEEGQLAAQNLKQRAGGYDGLGVEDDGHAKRNREPAQQKSADQKSGGRKEQAVLKSHGIHLNRSWGEG